MFKVNIFVTLILTIFSTNLQAKHIYKESVYQSEICTQLSGETEYRTKKGHRTRVDCFSTLYAIEVDFSNKWAESVGQSLSYAQDTGKRAGIVLIMESHSSPTHLAILRRLITNYKLPITLWTVKPTDFTLVPIIK